MIIDILMNSCARPDLLEKSVYSTRENVTSNNHTFRWVIVEDLVDNLERRKLGRQWIENNSHLFDEIIFSDMPAVVGKYWQKIIKVCESPYHVHAEDDTNYLKKINIDSIIDFLENNDNVIEIVFCRSKVNPINRSTKIILDGLKLTESRLMSNSVGVFNTKNVKALLDEVGWESVLHENFLLTPACDVLGFRRFVLGHDEQHYIHTGQDKKYRKGKWESV